MEKLLFPDLRRESMATMEDGDGSEEDDDVFYEEIEAPKFVDFTIPNRSRPTDPSWFCVRVGCDEMHEMVDPKALHKSFVLRVMAARSPNVRLRKVLYKQSASSIPKCPNSAPPKPAKDRVLRFSRITSVPEKMTIAKIKEHPISSLRLTPKKTDSNARIHKIEKCLTTPKKTDIKAQPRTTTDNCLTTPKKTDKKAQPHVIEKYLTTPPRVGRTPGNQEALQSVKNQKTQVLASKTKRGEAERSRPTRHTPVSESSYETKKLKIGSALKNTPKVRLCNSSRCAASDAKCCDPEKTPLSVKKKTNEEINCNASAMNVASENSRGDIEETDDDDKENVPDSQNTRDDLHSSNMNSLKQHPQRVKFKKMKPTNPKPFRLRTDERGILKEANLERKLQNSAQKKITHVAKQGDEIQQQTDTTILKVVTSTHQSLATTNNSQCQKLEEQQKMVKFASSSNSSAKKNTSMKGKRPTTIPKEPNFHRIHLPKGCTKRQEL
ncbi:hypothetical protein J5N97_028484 [Dioscorea zingiberensis]|uniref:Uncharacterized protein n=1 Tax=Dioscorea zingiberensis TaxID=325984 RepID=A0A9D5H4X3_9LILI|nr:hypothetical protein J5N97_028484 [Dioscorea zingiberensis]